MHEKICQHFRLVSNLAWQWKQAHLGHRLKETLITHLSVTSPVCTSPEHSYPSKSKGQPVFNMIVSYWYQCAWQRRKAYFRDTSRLTFWHGQNCFDQTIYSGIYPTMPRGVDLQNPDSQLCGCPLEIQPRLLVVKNKTWRGEILLTNFDSNLKLLCLYDRAYLTMIIQQCLSVRVLLKLMRNKTLER